MKKIVILLLFALVVFPGNAMGASGVYLGLKMGYSDTDIKTSNSFGSNGDYESIVFSGAMGYDFYPQNGIPLRVEFEQSFQGGDQSDGRAAWVDVDLLSLSTVNFWYDFRQINEIFRPYAGGGVGFAVAWFDTSVPEGRKKYDRDNAMVYQVGGGIGLQANKRMCFDFSYRFVKTKNFETNYESYRFKLQNHTIMAGLRITF